MTPMKISDVRITTVEFNGLSLESIKEFQFQTRPYEWVTFKNVSLKPGFKTDVQVEVGKSTSEKSADTETHIQTVTFKKGISIREALRFLAEKYKENIIPSEKVEGQVAVTNLYDVTFEEILQAILGTHKYIIDGNVIHVYTEEEYKALFKTAGRGMSRRSTTTRARPARSTAKRPVGKTSKLTTKPVEKLTDKEDILKKLRALNQQLDRVETELNAVERSLDALKKTTGYSDLEEHSYPHPVTQRFMRLQLERDNTALEEAQLQGQIGNLKGDGKTTERQEAQDKLVISQRKLEELEKMVEQAAKRKQDFDFARAQYQRRKAIRDERRKIRDAVKAEIDKYKIMYDEAEKLKPQPEAKKLTKKTISEKLMVLNRQLERVERDLSATERSLDTLKKTTGFTDLEERSYPHPVTQRFMRLQLECDNTALEVTQMQVEIENLKADGKTDELKEAKDRLVILQRKFEKLTQMKEQAARKKQDFDFTRSQYERRKAIRDERRRARALLKVRIEELKILHDDPQTPPIPRYEKLDGMM